MQDIEDMSKRMRDELALTEKHLALYKKTVERQTQAKVNEFLQTADASSKELLNLKASNASKKLEIEQAFAYLKDLAKLSDIQKEEHKVRRKHTDITEALVDPEPNVPELAQRINATKAMVRDLTKAVQMYEKRLGMQIKRLEEAKIQVSFRYISRERPDLVHSFIVSVVEGKYVCEVVSQFLPGFDAAVETLNNFGDFSGFVRAVRLLFKQLYV